MFLEKKGKTKSEKNSHGSHSTNIHFDSLVSLWIFFYPSNDFQGYETENDYSKDL